MTVTKRKEILNFSISSLLNQEICIKLVLGSTLPFYISSDLYKQKWFIVKDLNFLKRHPLYTPTV